MNKLVCPHSIRKQHTSMNMLSVPFARDCENSRRTHSKSWQVREDLVILIKGGRLRYILGPFSGQTSAAMSATATAAAVFASSPATRSPGHLPTRKPRNPIFHGNCFASSSSSRSSSLLGRAFFITNRSIHGSTTRRSSLSTTGVRPFSPVMEWQDCTWVSLYSSWVKLLSTHVR